MAEDARSRKVFHAGDVIMQEGDAATGAYLIQSGKVEVYTKSDNKKMHLAYLGKEEVIGEAALIDRGTRNATVAAVETTVCIFIDRLLFEKKMQSADPFLRALLRVLVARQRAMIKALREKM